QELSMSPLRRRLIEDMQIRNLTPNTQRAYVAQVVHFACHFRKSPDLLGPAEIRAYLIYLAQEKGRAASSMIVTVSALRISEAVRLTPATIDSKRMVIRVEQGKGQKDRYVMLSPKLLDMLRTYWDRTRPGEW